MLVKFERLLVFSESHKKSFCAEFGAGVNIVKGRNTSGKSTLIQSLIYLFGINDGGDKLKEIIDYDSIFRLDLKKIQGSDSVHVTFVRESGVFYVFEEGKAPRRFDGVDADNSREHVKLKKVLSDLFGFRMLLEARGGLKSAPLEAMMLPYYVSQSVGWVYIRESFSGLGFYKNFKSDYLDYYLGVTTDLDRVSLNRLLREKSDIRREIDFLERKRSEDTSIKVSILLDEEYRGEAEKYLDEYAGIARDLADEESKNIKLCNEKSLIANRLAVLRKVKSNVSKQRPDLDPCPVCSQTLPSSLEALYGYHQDFNDTDDEIQESKKKLVSIQSKINASSKKISNLNDVIESRYMVLKRYQDSVGSVAFDSWLQNKSKVKMDVDIRDELAAQAIKLDDVLSKIESFGADDAEAERVSKEKVFVKLFNNCLSKLGLAGFEEKKYNSLYSINSFPYQGVELHKTIIAYHFAFNALISKNPNIHRFPFILDAVMKEDIEEHNRRKIFEFLNDFSPKDTQMIFSVSESLSDSVADDVTSNNIDKVNYDYFGGEANIIQIGDGDSERAFLSDNAGKYQDIIDSTLDMISID